MRERLIPFRVAKVRWWRMFSIQDERTMSIPTFNSKDPHWPGERHANNIGAHCPEFYKVRPVFSKANPGNRPECRIKRV